MCPKCEGRGTIPTRVYQWKRTRTRKGEDRWRKVWQIFNAGCEECGGEGEIERDGDEEDGGGGL